MSVFAYGQNDTNTNRHEELSEKPGLYVNGQHYGKLIIGEENVVNYIPENHPDYVYPSYEYQVTNGRKLRNGDEWIIIPNDSPYENATTVTVVGVTSDGLRVRLMSYNRTSRK